jgi:branched-chain amino acid aminotransferase
MVRGGTLVTPPLSSPILAGITRESILTIANELSIPVVEDRFTRDDLYVAEEAFFSGTAAEVTPIREIDGRTLGNGQRGPITTRLQEEFFKVLRGETDRWAEWRTVYRI